MTGARRPGSIRILSGPSVLALLYRVFGTNALWGILLNIVLGVATNLVIGLLAWRLFGRSVGVLAATLAIFCGAIHVFDFTLLRDSGVILLSVLLPLLAIDLRELTGAEASARSRCVLGHRHRFEVDVSPLSAWNPLEPSAVLLEGTRRTTPIVGHGGDRPPAHRRPVGRPGSRAGYIPRSVPVRGDQFRSGQFRQFEPSQLVFLVPRHGRDIRRIDGEGPSSSRVEHAGGFIDHWGPSSRCTRRSSWPSSTGSRSRTTSTCTTSPATLPCCV